jgi:hypothetical protein
MIERKSPGLSAFYATSLMIFILLTQRYLFAFFRRGTTSGMFKQGFDELIDGLITGARNMIGIAIATAAAGIIVGAVSQTGVGLKLAALVEFLSMGHIMLILLWTGILSLILGMGLPTTANYIVVSSLLAPVIVSLGQQNGLIVPLIAVHMFVFYFGIMADVTPPVGLASFAAAAISGGDPIKTGFVAFFYSLRTALLPFLFIFNTDLLLMNVTFMEGIFVFVIATMAMLIFTAGTQGYFIAKSKLWESGALILIAFTLSMEYKSSNYINTSSNSNDIIANDNNYENLIENAAFIDDVAIQSKVISDNYIKVFIPFKDNIENRVFSFNKGLKPEEDDRGLRSNVQFGNRFINSIERDSIRNAYLKTFNDIYRVKIDTSYYETEFIFALIKSDKLGFETYISTKELNDGKHILKVNRKYITKEKDTIYRNVSTIPFYYFKDEYSKRLSIKYFINGICTKNKSPHMPIA